MNKRYEGHRSAEQLRKCHKNLMEGTRCLCRNCIIARGS